MLHILQKVYDKGKLGERAILMYCMALVDYIKLYSLSPYGFVRIQLNTMNSSDTTH
jgi:hypothetical protein